MTRMVPSGTARITTNFFFSSSKSLTKQMCPDVASLCVDAEDALEASPKGGHRWSVAM